MMKLTTSLVVVLGLCAFGCSKKKEENAAQKSDPAMTPKTTEPPKPETPPPPAPLTGTALADKYKACLEMINASKFDDFKKDCVADSYTAHAVGGMPEMKGADAVIAFFKDQKTAMPDWKLQPQLVMVSGRNILAVNLVTGTHSGPMKTMMGEMKPTNKKLGMMWFHRLQIDDANKATDEYAYADMHTMMGQLGMAHKGMPATRPAMDKGIEGAPVTVVTADDAKEKANLEAVKKGNDAFIANKPADLMATMADNAVEHDMTGEKDTTGKKNIEKGFTTFRSAWTDVKTNDVNMWAAGDWVIQTLKFEGKHDKDLGKIKKTGKTVSLDVTEVMHFKDGKIDHMWRFGNGMDMAVQLGLMPAPGAAAGDMKGHEGHDMKGMGKDIKEGAKDAGKAVKEGAKDVKDATKKAAGEVKEEVKK
jgi:predicted ester cyclase